jgi:hypothetical protein
MRVPAVNGILAIRTVQDAFWNVRLHASQPKLLGQPRRLPCDLRFGNILGETPRAELFA